MSTSNHNRTSSNNNKQRQRQSTVPLIAGTFGGAASTILLYPLDLVKVRLQVNESSSSNTSTGTSASSNQLNTNQLKQQQQQQQQQQQKQPIRKVSMIPMMRGIVRHEGVIGLYTGITPAIVGSAAAWGGYFFLYEGIKSRFMEHKRRQNRNGNGNDTSGNGNGNIKLGPKENFTAACLSGAVMVGFTNPIWLIKTRMQLQMKKSQESSITTCKRTRTHTVSKSKSNGAVNKIKPPYKNMLDAAKTIIKEEGMSSLYKGSIPALMLVSHGGVQFVVYEFLKGHFGSYQKASRSSSSLSSSSSSVAVKTLNNNTGTVSGTFSESKSVLIRLEDSLGYLTMGAISKMIATTITYPLQVMKSRLQQRSQTAEMNAIGEVEIVKRQYKGVIDVATKIWKMEGLYGFFKGCVPNAIRVAPSAAITFVVYESIVDMMSNDV